MKATVFILIDGLVQEGSIFFFIQ